MLSEFGQQPDGVASILVVEDDPRLRLLLVRSLRENGFESFGAPAGAEMWRILEKSKVDLILLDVMLPGKSGLDLCRALRQKSNVPIVMVSARGEELDRVLGLELGADDYISKPFGSMELLARVRAVLRRVSTRQAAAGPEREVVTFDGWSVDLRRRQLTSENGVEVELSGAEYDLLMSFISNAQRIIGRERLLELSRSRLSDASDRSIDVLVSRLRRKLSDAGSLIKTVRGVGYMFVAEVERH